MVFDIFKTNPRVAKRGLASQWTQVPRDVPFLGATWNMAWPSDIVEDHVVPLSEDWADVEAVAPCKLASANLLLRL